MCEKKYLFGGWLMVDIILKTRQVDNKPKSAKKNFDFFVMTWLFCSTAVIFISILFWFIIKTKFLIGNSTKSFILAFFFSLNSNLFKWTIRTEGNFQISIFFVAFWNLSHFGHFHLLWPSKISSFVNSSTHSSSFGSYS